MKSYLSIDLDYFANDHSDFCNSEDVEKHLIKFMDKVYDLNVPIYGCTYHNDILDDLNKHKVDKLYNIDYHSDVVYESFPEIELDEGTWVNFYKYRKNCTFEWRYPSTKECFTEGWGICDWIGDKPAPWSKAKLPYKNSIRRQGIQSIGWDSIVGVGISLSPNWCAEWIYPYYKDYGLWEFMP